MPERRAHDYLPMSEAMFHVLLSLADGGAHGYGIMKGVAERTDGRVQLSTGTLYGIVKRLLADGLIQEVRRRGADRGERRRRQYLLTPFGREVATAEAARLKGLVAAARAASLLPRRV
ncbi:MAG TPA: helix-turn-helix transcriptional regulator [Vicinamibacterales bacterium]|nr:helix-turn-helix transcriptional regulator [Vicinamibacterales bacterium]